MEQYCQTNSYEKEPRVSRENLGYIIVNDEYKFIYCTIPKVGTTTWKNVFAELRGLRHNAKVHILESPQLGHRFLCSLGFVGHLFFGYIQGHKRPQVIMYTLCLINAVFVSKYIS